MICYEKLQNESDIRGIAVEDAGKDLEGKGFDPRKIIAPDFEAIKASVK